MDYNQDFFINKNKISFDSPTYFIADIAANHDGDIEKAKELIWLAAEAGADAAKFQHFAAKSIVSDFGFKNLGTKMSHQATWKKSVYDTYDDAAINADWTETLVKTCKEANIDFFTSPYSLPLVDVVDPYVPAYKVGSGDITFLEIIEYMAQKGKPVLVATGASSFADVKRAVDAVLKHTPNIALMQCNTNYTASVENFKYINLNVINTFKKEYPGMILGLSDHTKGDSTVLAAITLGARVIEKHFTDNNDKPGPDHGFSMNPVSWREMVNKSREVENALGSGIKVVEENELESVILQRRCLRLTKDLRANHVITADDLVALRPAPKNSYDPYRKSELIGKTLKVDKVEGDAIFKSDI
jgi:sialic acid synthase SpsE